MNLVKNWFDKLSSSDKRKAPRADSPLLVAYYWDGAVPMAHKIKNISTTGFYLLTRERWHPGTVITMTLQRSDASSSADHYISVMSKVVRLGQDGVGFTFVPLEAKGSDLAKAIPKSRPAGKRALGKFLEQLNLDGGSVVVGSARADLDASLEAPKGGIFARSKDESGQAMILAALCMTCLLGFVALAADVGIMLHEKRLAQIAADSAAIAGSADIRFGAVSAAQAAAAQNGFTNGSNGATVVVNTTPTSGPFVGGTGYIEVIVSQSQPTLFMALFGRTTMTVTARAVATNAAGNTCMYLLGPTGADLTLSNTGGLNVRTCGILVNSTSSNAISLTNRGSIVAQTLGVAASAPGFADSGSGTITASPLSTGVAQVSDPLAFLPSPSVSPAGSCTAFLTVSTTTTISPGCYAGLDVKSAAALTMSAGNYVFTGPVTFESSGSVTMGAGTYQFNNSLSYSGSGNVTGTGVTFYLTTATGPVTLAGTGIWNLSAPTSGTYNGILFFEDRGDTAPLTINQNGARPWSVAGIFYLPGAALNTIGPQSMVYNAAIVANQLNVSSPGTLTLNNYAAVNTATPLTSTRLVE